MRIQTAPLSWCSKFLLFACTLAFAISSRSQVPLEEWSSGGTLRIDCLRVGYALSDEVHVIRWIDRDAPWHGSHTQLIDPFDNGDYRVVVKDATTGSELYSRNYSNLFREYKDTPEGGTTPRAFEEVVLIPMPRIKVKIALQHRDSLLHFVDQHIATFDPDTTHVILNHKSASPIPLVINGPVGEKVDVVIVAQGYDSDSALQKLPSDLGRMKNILFLQEPFRSHAGDFNVRAIVGDAGARFGTFNIDRYLMTEHLFRLHDLIGSTPADYIIIMVNSKTYGGGAIYNFYAVSTLHEMAAYVLPHEFGHCFGGLADEYVDEDLSYANLHRTNYEPLEPNITNLVDFANKWQHLIPDGIELPSLPDETIPRNECGPIGLYEGAGYSREGVFRPTMRCMMRDYAPFCPVCSERLEGIFRLYTR